MRQQSEISYEVKISALQAAKRKAINNARRIRSQLEQLGNSASGSGNHIMWERSAQDIQRQINDLKNQRNG